MTDQAALTPSRPRFSLVSAAYNVEKYIDDFIASVEAQDYPLELVQIVLVDDGSTDSTPRILADWQARRPGLVTIVTKPNGGIASARNAGLPHVRGEWVSFPDSDDMLAPDYLTEVDAFLTKHPHVFMAATKRTFFLENTGEMKVNPLERAHFGGRNAIRNLDREPEFFHQTVNSAFFRSEIVAREGVRFDERVRPAGEDGHFCVHYLLRLEEPLVAFIGTASYTYRKRLDKTSALDSTRTDPAHYTDQVEYGYLDVLETARSQRGHVPHWLQTNMIYQICWYFRDDVDGLHLPRSVDRDVVGEFHQLLARFAGYLDPLVLTTYRLRPFDLQWREVLLHAYEAEPWHSAFALVTKFDTSQRLVRVTYRYTHACPEETFFSNGVVVQPVFEKIRAVVHFDRPLMFERIVWLPVGSIRVVLNGTDAEVRLKEPERPLHSMPLGLIRKHLAPARTARSSRQTTAAKRRGPTLSERLVVRLYGSRVVTRFFGDAWVLMDRIDDASDNGEILFRYMREHRRNVNAWFVIHGGTPDHRRLLKDGYKRVIPHGSMRWKLLMLNAQHVISSHVDEAASRPAAITRLVEPRWRTTFLQHGVIQDDLSRWLNDQDLDLVITSTPAEHESIVASGSPYRYTEREVQLTGMPRLDLLRAAEQRVQPDDRDLILLTPTWRDWLTTSDAETGRSTLSLEELVSTEVGVNWLHLMSSTHLKDLVEKTGLRVGLLLHPDLQSLSTELDLPEHIEVFRYEGEDVPALLARARVLVTDYSSVAFDAAYMDRPVVYFQSDRESAWAGEHLGSPGYWDYDRDGFGPVTHTLDDALEAIADTVAAGPSPRPAYLARIAETFPLRDGRCTERVFEAIRRSTKRARKTVPATGNVPAVATPDL